MVNINIEIPDDLHKKVKLAAIKTDKTVKDFIIEKLGEELGRRRQ